MSVRVPKILFTLILLKSNTPQCIDILNKNPDKNDLFLKLIKKYLEGCNHLEPYKEILHSYKSARDKKKIDCDDTGYELIITEKIQYYFDILQSDSDSVSKSKMQIHDSFEFYDLIFATSIYLLEQGDLVETQKLMFKSIISLPYLFEIKKNEEFNRIIEMVKKNRKYAKSEYYLNELST